MKDDFISELVRAGESQTIEFAAAHANVEKIGRTICGFANAEGGTNNAHAFGAVFGSGDIGDVGGGDGDVTGRDTGKYSRKVKQEDRQRRIPARHEGAGEKEEV